MAYWLMKSEPDTFSIDDLQRVGREPWDGVRNYQARNMLRDQMQIGDQVLFYHSACAEPGIAGIAEIASTGYPDATAFEPASPYYDPASTPVQPRWYGIDVKFIKKLQPFLPLRILRQQPELAEMLLLRKGNRLSVMPVTPLEWVHILGMSSD